MRVPFIFLATADGAYFYYGLGRFLSTTDKTALCPMAIKEIKKFVAFPGLMPLQPDAYAQPCKQASLADPPHPSGLPCRQTGKHQNKIAALGSTK